jgi:hypothetical protein
MVGGIIDRRLAVRYVKLKKKSEKWVFAMFRIEDTSEYKNNTNKSFT